MVQFYVSPPSPGHNPGDSHPRDVPLFFSWGAGFILQPRAHGKRQFPTPGPYFVSERMHI